MSTKLMPKEIREYLPALQKRVITRVILSNIIVTLIILFCLVITHLFSPLSMTLWTILIVYFSIGVISSLIIVNTISVPIRDILSAIIHVAGEPTDVPAPSPNDEKYDQTGMQTALQTVYELASHQTKTGSIISSVDPVINTALNQTLTGFVILDNNRKILFSNRAAPVSSDKEGVFKLDLMFNGKDTLDAWLDECETESVHAEKIWTRIANKLPEEEGRRLFDVITSYEKGAIGETVLTLIDKTSAYSVSENELDFIAFAAHELRGPITVIRGYLDVLEDELSDVLAEDQHELFRRLTVSANRLSGYINNILNTSRYDRRHLSVHLNEDTVSNVFSLIDDDMQMRATAQNRLLAVNIPSDLPTVAVDRASMSEVFGNLIDNAIKYSNEGGSINVSASVKGNFIEIAFEDHGIGMPGNVVSNLFQKFYRSHRSRETVAGTGIGLYISKAIVESHGGVISVRSEDGIGSTFTVSLPIFSTVADKLRAGNNSNQGLIDNGNGWIKNHSMYRG